MNTARELNKKQDTVAYNARVIREKQEQKTYEDFSFNIKKFHEKMLIRQELAEWRQYDIKEANRKEFDRHVKNAQKVKQLDRDKLMQSI